MSAERRGSGGPGSRPDGRGRRAVSPGTGGDRGRGPREVALLVAAVAIAGTGCFDGFPFEPDCPPASSGVSLSIAPAPDRSSPYDEAFEAAGREFGVPPALLRSVGWVETRWQMVRGSRGPRGRAPAFGVMALRGEQLERGAELAGVTVEAARTEPGANVRAAAALLDSLAAATGVDRSDLGGWAPAVARLSGIEVAEGRAAYLREGVFGSLGVPLPDDPAGGGAARTSRIHGCPDGAEADDTRAVWRPSPNFNERPDGATGDPHVVVVHTCEGNYAGCWSWLVNRESGVSSHYVVNEEGTEISQLVREENRAWHIAASYDCSLNHEHDCWLDGVQGNDFTVGIEHAGFASQEEFPASQVRASAALVCRISRRLDIPRDFRHVVGHGRLQPGNRTDPGPNWPWTEYVTSIQRHCGETVADDSAAFADGDVARVEAPDAWTATAQTPGYYAAGYRWAPTSETADDPLVFSFRLPEPGSRTVEVRWTAGSNRTAGARYSVVAASGDTLATLRLDQRTNGGEWRELGRWDFPSGWNEVVLSRRGPSGSVVVGDAVRVR